MFDRYYYALLPIFIVFITHGILYNFFSAQHYSVSPEAGGPISLIKYLCLILTLPLLPRLKISSVSYVWFLFGAGLFILVLTLQLWWLSQTNILLFQYTFCILGYFFAPFLVHVFSAPQRVKVLIILLVAVSIFSIFYELANGGIGGFSRGGFRATGPFVNPNNSGIVLVLIAVLFHHYFSGLIYNIAMIFLMIAVLALLGSKTAMGLYAAYHFFFFPLRWKIICVILSMAVGLLLYDRLVELFFLMELRTFDLESGHIRSRSYQDFFEIAFAADLADFFFGFSAKSIVDNNYLDIWSYGGLYLLALSVIMQFASVILCICKKYWLLTTLHTLLALAMMTTNISRLWPTGYFLWAVIGLSFYLARETIFRKTHIVSTVSPHSSSHDLVESAKIH